MELKLFNTQVKNESKYLQMPYLKFCLIGKKIM